ncbi:hypothetical protein PAXRUDRAFT_8878 [Paxillus rubicundulus Ve08.2h10]|uniref:HAT C-terminal dimerisation domain-containing protein n=1 Tax=Paxillus rubicundulus Ve08.2h10 TaxID=930991 RepID=A0A0D0ECI0_9AGAM|nr:hypothetical protein PAXRUDRAFT_8878 [Paxillus rubicundulus Ve08.2h10]
MHILSIVPNTASTERLFSQFGIVHTKLRNWLNPEKVRKQVLIRMDIMQKYPLPAWASQKCKFSASDKDEAEKEPCLVTTDSQPNNAPMVSLVQEPVSHGTPESAQEESLSESLIAQPFQQVVDILVAEAIEANAQAGSN